MDVTKPSRLEEICLDLVNKLRSDLRPQPYSIVDLRRYTLNLSNKIGCGAYGEVYKGQLPDGVLVAVKVLKNNDIMEDTFLAAVRILGKAFHLNLVKLYGYCFEDSIKALVFEYMENGSLDKILHENHHPSIEWVTLYGIAIEIARGLKYLHDEMDDHIIHYDIKASNVLLDKNFSAKITDFGLYGPRDSRVTLTNSKGTFGYMAPETILENSKVTSKSNVYSFGMMLFEILGKIINGREKNWFPKNVWNQFKSGNLQQLIKDCGIKEKDKENAIRLSKVALWCVQFIPDLRPSMEDVVFMLQDKKQIEDPPYPLFLDWQDSTSQVVSEECRANNERERLNSLEHGDPKYPQNIIADQTNAPVAGGYGKGGYGKDSLPQLRSNVPNKRSLNTLEEDLAIFVLKKRKKFRPTKLVGKTTLKYSKMILKWISKDEGVTFCINGMGGVGKTAILDDVYNQLIAKDLERNRKHFDNIIWVSVSKDDKFIKLLQKDLAKELEIKLPSDDVLERSRVLSQALEKRKKVVLFLDDIWKEISLDEIGIPHPTLENGCKLLFTTRNLDMSRRMRCNKTITVEPLPKDEAWDLFMKKVNYVLTPEVRKVAEMVAKKCSGLPLAIITVGKAMSDEKYSNIEYWIGALNELNLKDPSNETMDMEMENVYKCLEFSYDRLGDDKQRECFLCCALYPESCPILKRNLLEFWIMEGIVVGIDRQDELRKGRYILNKLKSHCLLETVDKVYDDEYRELSDGVKMHNLIRDMALRLKNKCFMVKDGPSLRELPNEEEWVDVEKASFMCNQIGTLSISPICPNLSTLILEGTFLKSVSHEFFVHMKCLKVLDLRCDRMSRNKYLKLLPDSISVLENLRVLRLSWYKNLNKLPSLAKLVFLRTLEFNNTSIKELPEGMEVLVNLRCLNLHGVQLKERIPFGLISKLSALQELYLGGIEVDKLYEVGKGEFFAVELLSLEKLENLSVSFHWLSDYASYVGSPKFKRLTCFYLSISGTYYCDGNYLGPPPHATVQICYPADKHTVPFFPQNTKRVEAESFDDVITLNELGWLIKDVKELVAFSVLRCDKMECMWSSKQNEEFSATGTSSICWLQSLEKIEINACTKVYTLFEGIPISSGVFCLKELRIYNCNNLKNVFPSSRLMQLFPKLEEITVSDCGEIEELIGDDVENSNTETPISIPRLKSLCIMELPKLKRIYRGVIICYSLERVSVEKCLELKKLPRLKGDEDHSTPPSALRQISGSREWWDSLEWDPDYPQNILQPFFIEVDPLDLMITSEEEEEEDFISQSDGEDSLMLEGEKISQSDECSPEGVGDLNSYPDGEDSLMLGGEKSSQSDECALNLELALSSQHTYGEFGEAHVTMDPYGETEEMQIQYDLNLSLGIHPSQVSCARDLNSHPDGEDSLMLGGEKSSQSDECALNLELALSSQHTYSNTEFGDAHVTMDPYGETEEMQIQYALNLSLGISQAHNYAPLQSPLPNEILKQPLENVLLPSEVIPRASPTIHESLAISNPTLVAAPDVFVNAFEEEEKNSDDEQATSNLSKQLQLVEIKTSSEIGKLPNEMKTIRPQSFSLSDLKSWTSKFSEKIGSGGYGVLYKGQFLDGMEVVVKVLHDMEVFDKTFMDVVMELEMVNHPNIVKLHGYCFDGHMKALVYEFFGNGSLDIILYRNHRRDIEWKQLCEIAIETAKGLSVLHAAGIIHRDIKASNILLNSNLSPKIRSFGLECLIIMKSNDDVTRIAGSYGYSAPETWIPTSEVTSKSDVYSFGMLLFEVLGRRCITNHRGQEWFPAQVWMMLDKGLLGKIREDCGINKKDRKRAYNLSKVALWCAQFDPLKRPSMSSVVKMLEMEIPIMDPPNPFPYAQLSSTSSSPEVNPRFNSEASPSTKLSFLEKKSLEEKSRSGGDWDELSELHSRLDLFQEKCPPEGENFVVLYTTVGWQDRITECNYVRSILKSHQVEIIERDISANSAYWVELRKLLDRTEVPALFVHGRLIGGVNEVKSLEEEGKLKFLLYIIPVWKKRESFLAGICVGAK